MEVIILKKLSNLIIVTTIVSLLIICGSQSIFGQETYSWKMSQPYPEGTMLYNVTEAFIERVESASNGRIKITHYPSDLLGDYVTQQEGVQSGGQELAYTWPVTKMSPKWDIMGIGYTGWNSQHGLETWGPDGWLLPVVDQIAEEVNWKVLGIAPSGSTTTGDIVISNQSFDPDNPEGRKIRVQGSQNYTKRYEALGFSPITMPMSEVSSALALGTIDASAGCVPTEFTIYGDSFTYGYLYADTLFPALLILNRDVWDSLSPLDQKILEEAGDMSNHPNFGWEAWENDVIRNMEEDLLDWQILVTPDGDSWAARAEKARDAEWAYLETVIGKDLMDIVRENAVELPWGLSVDEMEYGYGEVYTTEWLIERQGAVYTKNPPPVNK